LRSSACLLAVRSFGAARRPSFASIVRGAGSALLGVGALLGVTGCGLDLKGELASVDDSGVDSMNPQHSGSSSGTSGSGSSGDPRSDGGPGSPGEPDAGDSGDSASGPVCDYSGTWATKITIDVDWVPQGIMGVILAPGAGKIQQWIKSVRTQSGTMTTDSAVVCGIGLPDFSGTSFVGGETYGVRFPPTLFDSGDLPPFPIHGTLGDTGPTAPFSTSATAALIGLTLANAATATWPATVTTAVDSDNDDNPGVTVNAAAGSIAGNDAGVYSDFPVDVFKSRANQLFIVIRQVTALTGTATDCGHISGSVSIPKIPDTTSGKYAIDSHVVGCNLTAGGICSSSQISFIDGTQPVFSPIGSGTFASVRLSAGASCLDVRTMLPAQ
jgi:hypothetical protein